MITHSYQVVLDLIALVYEVGRIVGLSYDSLSESTRSHDDTMQEGLPNKWIG